MGTLGRGPWWIPHAGTQRESGSVNILVLELFPRPRITTSLVELEVPELVDEEGRLCTGLPTGDIQVQMPQASVRVAVHAWELGWPEGLIWPRWRDQVCPPQPPHTARSLDHVCDTTMFRQ